MPTPTAETTHEYPRRFVTADADMGDWSQIEPHFEKLVAWELNSPSNIERWLEDISELAACIDEAESERYVAMTCQTDDPEREKRYLDFVENVTPKCKPRWHRLRERYAACPHTAELPRDRYEVLDRSIRNHVALYRDENVPLETEDEKLRQTYDKTIGVMTVEFDGSEQTLPRMTRYQEEPDRDLRRQAWEATTERRLADAEQLDELYDRMIALRTTIAKNAGFDNYRDYIFSAYERFDYTPDDCRRFHDSIEELVVPLLRMRQAKRREQLGVESLRPWDLGVDPMGRAPLTPFKTADELRNGCSRIFHRISPDLGRQFDRLGETGMLDLESRKGKAPGGYQCCFDERRMPFIFMNAVGLQRDIETLVHEGGHAFHSFAARDDPIHDYRSAPIEFCEVASMSMELLALPHLDEFYPDADERRRARLKQLEGVVTVLPWIATIDAFQHWIYTHPDHRHDERRDAWLRALDRFGGDVDWTGQDRARTHRWQAQLHLYRVPLYYVEYGIAQVGALGVWTRAQRDTEQAVAEYRAALALGGSRPLPELFSAAGIRFDFSAPVLKPLIETLTEALHQLDD